MSILNEFNQINKETTVFFIMNLEENFTDVNIEDPTAMDKILMLLEDLQAEDEEFMEVLSDKSDLMTITWEQPWYQQTRCLTRPVKLNDNNLPKFKTDSICKEESDQIHENWRRFRKLFGVPNKLICLARWRNKAKSKSPNTPEEFVRRYIISYLAQGLERNLYQVYKHVVARYGSKAKGCYSKHEEKLMAICLFHNPKNAVPYLSAVLGREPRGIYKRMIQMYQGKPAKKRFRWTLPLATKFLNLLLEYTGEPLEELKYKSIDKSVWLKLEENIGQLHIYLQSFWYNTLHTQLFVKCDIKVSKLRKHLFKSIKLYPYKIWGDIRWKDLLKHVPDGFTHHFLHHICHSHIRSCDGYLNLPLELVLEYGLKKIKSIRNRRIKALVLNKNQELEVIKYNEKPQYI